MDHTIPENWHRYPLVEVSKITLGQSPSSEYYTEHHKGLPFLQGTADFGVIKPHTRIFCTQPTKECEKNDILISVRAPVGELNIADQRYCIGRGLSSIRGNPSKICQAFLFYALLLERQQLYRLMQGTTFDAVNRDNLNSILISVPELIEEQEKIVAILQNIDDAISKTMEIIEKNQKMKEGLLNDFYNSEHLKGSSRCLKDCCVFVRDGTHGSFEDYQNGIPLLSAKDVIEGKIIMGDSPRRITLKDYHSIHSKYEIKEGDVVLTIVGTIGRSALVEKVKQKFTFQRSVAILRPQENVLPAFLYYYLNTTQFKKDLENSVNASAQGGVYLGTLKRMSIIIPFDIIDQSRIVDILKTMDVKINLEKLHLKKLERIKTGLMNDLLRGSTRVSV